MLQHVVHGYKMNFGFTKLLVADLSADQMCQQPHGVINHPAWSLGHLAATSNGLCRVLGLNSDLPAGWEETFKPVEIPSANTAAFPSKEELLRVLEAQHALVVKAVSEADPAALASPSPDERARAYFPTVGDYTVYVMIAHEWDHLGQLAAWRRAMGLGPVAV